MIRILRLPGNLRGRDFVMGDLHGETHLLDAALEQVRFDPERDRLFSVGDLIDRGRHSRRALDILDQPYFFSVLGNHEMLMLGAVLYGAGHERWRKEGGDWADEVDADELRRQAQRLDSLPHVIIVGEGRRRFHVVHAGLVDESHQPLTNAEIDAAGSESRIALPPLLHSRVLARQYKTGCSTGSNADALWHEGLSLTFCGHTPVAQPGQWRSHYLCDGGAGSEIYLQPGEQARLHLVCVNDILQA